MENLINIFGHTTIITTILIIGAIVGLISTVGFVLFTKYKTNTNVADLDEIVFFKARVVGILFTLLTISILIPLLLL